MNKQDRLTPALLALLCIILLWSGFSTRDRMRSLENQIRDLQLASSRNDLYAEIHNLRQSLKEEIERGASIVSSTETMVSFEDDVFDVGITVVPKAIEQGEEIYLILGEEKMKASSADGMAYTASFSVPLSENAQPYLSIESEGSKRQEQLPEVYFRDYLSLGVDSRMEHETNTLDVQIFALNEESLDIFDALDTVKLVIYDATKKELGRISFIEGSSGYSIEGMPEDKPGSKIQSYHLTIPANYYETNHFNASVVVTVGGATLISDDVYSYSKTGPVMESIGGGQFNISFGE